jgi:hypothetical protein
VLEVVFYRVGRFLLQNRHNLTGFELGRFALVVGKHLDTELGVAGGEPDAVFLHQDLAADVGEVAPDPQLAIAELAAPVLLPFNDASPSS